MIVTAIPQCDIHKYNLNTDGVPAVADGKTVYGPWANMCESCLDSYGIGLGEGKGQRFILDPTWVKS